MRFFDRQAEIAELSPQVCQAYLRKRIRHGRLGSAERGRIARCAYRENVSYEYRLSLTRIL